MSPTLSAHGTHVTCRGKTRVLPAMKTIYTQKKRRRSDDLSNRLKESRLSEHVSARKSAFSISLVYIAAPVGRTAA